MPRARILAAAEQEAFDSPPAFTALERKKHFALSETVRSLVDTLQTPTNRVCFVVTLAYFRATRKFFARQFYQGDLRYAAGLFGVEVADIGSTRYAESRAHHHRAMVLEYTGWAPFDTRARQVLTDQLRPLVRPRSRSKTTFIAERHFLYHSTVISSPEREAPFVIDGPMHNEVVKSDIRSTDTGGYNEMLFGVMRLLGFSYALRIKGFSKQQRYGFRRRKEYEEEGYRIVPDGYINTSLIEDQWDQVLRFVVTIKRKVTSATQPFKRLNSYSRQHPLYAALKEFRKIEKSLFLLKWIDLLDLRQAVEKQLNKGEKANRFADAICDGRNQEFLHAEKLEHEMAAGCNRLIRNAIICWNYLYLSQRLAEEPDVERRQALLTAFQNGSIVHWHHLNLHGEYDFSEERLRDSVGLDLSKIFAVDVP